MKQVTNKNINTKVLLIIVLTITIVSALKLKTQTQAHQFTQQHHNSQNGFMKHNQQKIYDEQQYLVQLAQTQNKFKDQITDIQDRFAGINMMLNDTYISQNQKNIKLNEALADERQALQEAQLGLNLPYQLKSCQCKKLSQQRKRDMQQQLQIIGQKIQQLQQASEQSNKHCQPHKCPLMDQVNAQIQMMRNYQKVMNDTITSQCCKVIKYAYKDNLDANNWHFGTTTQSQYQAGVYQRQKQQNVTLQPCPSSVPFVNLKDNTCYNCPRQTPLFNLGSRKCQKDCGEATGNQRYVLNLTTHKCGYNTNCPKDQYFDQVYNKCIPTPNYYNQSSCPPQKPFWDPQSFSCQSCPSQKPFYDFTLKKCRQCNDNQRWNQSQRLCVSITKCGAGYIYNSTAQKCVPRNSQTHSLCPPNKPFWNQNTFSCDTCPQDKPFFDLQEKECRQCRGDETFNTNTNQCVPKSLNVTCGRDQFYNKQTKECQKKGTTSMCPPSNPYWDAINFKCLKCPSDKPAYNQNTKRCQECPQGHTWSNKYLACTKQCRQTEQWSAEYRKCLKKDKKCPPKQAFSNQLNKCIDINCSQEKPYWNSTSNQCQRCPSGTTYNYVSNTCQSDSKSGNVSVCHEDQPLWNPQYLRCQACPQGKVWNKQSQTCITQRRHMQKSLLHNKYETQPRQEDNFQQQRIHGKVYGNSQISFQHKQLKMNL